jgi:hypothetical protein
MCLAPMARLSLLAWGNAPGFVVPKNTSAESAIHEELSYSPAQFRKVDQPPLTFHLRPAAAGLRRDKQSSPRKRGEAQQYINLLY